MDSRFEKGQGNTAKHDCEGEKQTGGLRYGCLHSNAG